VDTTSGVSSNYTVLFAGTEGGKLLKILLLNENKTLLLEERMVHHQEKCPGNRLIGKECTGIVLNLFLNFEKNELRVLIKFFLEKSIVLPSKFRMITP